MKIIQRYGVVLVGMLVTLAFSVNEALAIPAFARKYNTSCLTCHTQTPRVNSFGEAFRLSGFRWPEADPEKRRETDEAQRKQEPIKLGVEAYKKVWPEALWPSDFPLTIPIGVRHRTNFIGQSGGETLEKIAGELEVFAAGTLGEDMNFFGHFNAETFVTSTKETEDVKVKSMFGWLAWENLGDQLGLPDEDLLNLQIGMVGVDDFDFMHYRSHSTYRIDPTKLFGLSSKLPYPSGFKETNIYLPRRAPGVMFYGFTPRFLYNVGYTVGTQEGGGTDLEVLSLSMAHKIGGVDHYGRTEDKYAHGHQENALSLGLFASLGEAKVQATAASDRKVDNFWTVGPDVRWIWKDFRLHAGYMLQSHENPYGTLDPSSVDKTSWFVAPEYYVYPWLMLGMRYEWEEIDVPSAVGLGDRKRARIHPAINILARANVRFTLFGNIYTDERHDAAGTSLDRDEVGFTVDFTF